MAAIDISSFNVADIVANVSEAGSAVAKSLGEKATQYGIGQEGLNKLVTQLGQQAQSAAQYAMEQAQNAVKGLSNIKLSDVQSVASPATPAGSIPSGTQLAGK